jgi:hypothetical protein
MGSRPDGEPFAASGACMSVRGPARIGATHMGSKVDRRTVVFADWLKRCLAPVASAGERSAATAINGSYSILPSVSQKVGP